MRNLTKTWRGGAFFRGASTTAVAGVDLDVHPGEIVGLIGESGCGKTTLVRAALGLVRRDGGDVRVLGQDPAALGPRERADLRRRAQLLLQDPGASLNPGLPIRATLAESARLHRPDSPDLAEQALARFDLLPRADAWPHELSGGEKRRVTLAMLWISDPVLTIADEPTAGLDAARKAEVLDLLVGRQGPGRGFLLISHDLPLVLYACTRVLVMSAGRIVDTFTPSTLGEGPRHPLTRRLLWAAGMRAEPA